MREDLFLTKEDFASFSNILDQWTQDESGMKNAFIRLADRFKEKTGATLSMVSRPGISHSLRARAKAKNQEGKLIAMIDIVDDDPRNRWLSICFYGDCVTDSKEEGDLVPGGLLGEDGYCFDLYERDEALMNYLEERIDEAYENTLKETDS